MKRHLPLLALSLSLAGAAHAAPAPVTLAEGRQPRVVILVDAAVMASNNPARLLNPAKDEELQRRRLRDSANDLALYLKTISGAAVALSTNAAPAEGLLPVYIGSRAEAAFGPAGIRAPYRQGFRYVVDPQKGIGLYGESALASSYAIYELLDRLGCRWFMPGDRGEVIPALDPLTLPATDEKLKPGTTYRGVWYADDAWKRRNRCGGLLLSAGHALETTYLTKAQLAEHPEWLAQFADGRPMPGRFKWSSRPLADALADSILAKYAVEPLPSYSLSPSDGARFDESAADLALDAGDFDDTFQTNSITDRLLVLANRVAERVTAKQPDLLLGMLAYVQYTRPPVREPVHPAVVPQIAPITYSRAHPMNDDRVPGNPELRALIDGWGRKARQTSLYFYGYFLAEPLGPQPMLRKWGHDVPYVLARNCAFWQPETLPNFEFFMHAQYMALRLAWDPSRKPDDVYREINERFYGRAAAEMAAYWDFVDRVWTETPEFSGCGYGHLRRWTPARLREARTLMNAARKAAAGPDEKFRVDLANESLALFELFLKLRIDQAEGRWEGLMDRANAWHARLVADAAKYKEQYTFTGVPYSTNTLGGDYARAFYNKTYKDAQRIAETAVLMTRPPVRRFQWAADPDATGEAAGWATPAFDDSGWKPTDVCVETWSSLGLHNYFKSVWYRTPVTLPRVPEGKKVFLWIGSADGNVKAFVNGREVGSKESYAEPFSFDITAAVRPGEVNHLALFCTRTFFNELGTGGLLAPVAVYREK